MRPRAVRDLARTRGKEHGGSSDAQDRRSSGVCRVNNSLSIGQQHNKRFVNHYRLKGMANIRSSKTLASPLGAAIDPAEFLRPIEFLRCDHERQRSFCTRLDALVDDIHQPESQKIAASLLDFAIHDMSWAVEDEEELIAPAIMRRCAPEKGPTAVVENMFRQHRSVAKLAAKTIDGLDRLVAGSLPVGPLDFILSALQFAEILRRHLDWEDGVLLPLSVLRLTEEDQMSLGSSMARRRGMSLPSVHRDSEVPSQAGRLSLTRLLALSDQG